ncbi:MAG: IS1182 family transposase [Dialister sp.]|nr:IS1182 family transposase [Dialister sp.]MDY6115234.1 IS1182 family transposase [Dialister sp.]
MQNKINHVKYTKTYTPRQLVLPLNYGISLEQDRLVCIVDALLERLDYSALQHLYSVKGRNPKVPPKILFKVMVFAAAQGVYSLRSISEQCRVNIEYMWLLEGYPAPSHMTFGRFFHRIPIEVLRHLFAQFVHQLSLLDSVDFTEWYIDGTKMEANANRYTFVWRKRVEKGIAKLKEKRRQIQEQMLAFTGMDTFTLDDDELLRSAADVCQGNGITFVQGSGHRKTVEQKLFEEVAAIREKQQEYDAHLTILGTRNSYSKTDPDATFMRMKEDHMKNGQLKPAYNLQLAVQSEYIIGLGLFLNPTDTRTLIPFLTALESEYGRLADHIVADAGYDSEENMDWIEKKGSTVCIKPREYEYRKTSAFKKKIGHRSNMAYDADSDTYTCAKGRKLHFITEKKQRDRASGYEQTVRIYQCENCQYCGKRNQCQPTRTGKKPTQNKMVQYNPYYQSLLDRDYDFIHSEKGIQLRINRSIQIEGAFGTVKGNYEYRRVRHKGKESVEKELLFMAFGFNLRKYRSRRDTDRLQQHYLEKEETHTVAC